MRRMRVLGFIVVLAVAVLAALPGCGDDGSAAAGSGSCDAARREAFDPSSGQHVIGAGAEPEYLSDPPTSGPHQPGTVLGGVLADPVERPRQVGSLEGGGVLVQWNALDDEALSLLEGVAADTVAVVPNPGLDDPVVVTAWLWKLRCSAVDDGAIAAIEAFVTDHGGTGPGVDG